MILLYLTLAATAIVVVVLVVYLVGIIYYLRRANRHLEQLAGGLHAIRGHARPLPERMTTINQAMVALRDHLCETDRNLESAEGVFSGDREEAESAG